MGLSRYVLALTLVLTVGCGQLEERHVVGKARSYSQAGSGDGEADGSQINNTNDKGGNSASTPSNGTDKNQSSGSTGVPSPVVVAPKLKHADDLELINSWKVGTYEGNDLFKLTLTAALPFQ